MATIPKKLALVFGRRDVIQIGVLSLVGPTKVEASKSFHYTVKFPCIENNEHLVRQILFVSMCPLECGLK